MRIMTALLALTVACAPSEAPVPAGPDIQTREITYRQNGTSLQGLIAWDANAEGRRPGVLVVHEWWGHNDHARTQARRLAEAGYVGFALDMYGDGRHAMHAEDAQKLMTEATADPAVIVARFNAARAALTADAHVDPERVAAIGYCFGGNVVLSMARAGADLDAVASFHGVLSPLPPAVPGGVKARVLVLHGGSDPFVPAEALAAFRQEMTAAQADVRVVEYPNAKHGFTNPTAASYQMPELAYDAEADRESWEELLTLLRDTFRGN
jgi:dienelactone hydrolase